MLRYLILLSSILLYSCDSPWNSPYPDINNTEKTLFASVGALPKILDPAKTFYATDLRFIYQIYEAPLQYKYTSEYILEPSLLAKMPTIKYFDAKERELANTANSENIAYTIYTLKLKKDIFYQPHPAFAKQKRQVVAADIEYQLKRLAHPLINSPVYSLLATHIHGLKDLREYFKKHDKSLLAIKDAFISGVKVIDDHTLTIKINSKFPQFKYWLASYFFCPIPYEVIHSASYPETTLNLNPVGTGAFMLESFDPAKRIVLSKNPNFRTEVSPFDKEVKLPLLRQAIFTLEKEDVPFWGKFMQGYYDVAGISSDNFTGAIRYDGSGPKITEKLKSRNIQLTTRVIPYIAYWGLNYLDKIIGGDSIESIKLRQAIAICIDVEEFINIFFNGRGVAAHSVVPPDIMPSRRNDVVFDKNGRRRDISEAKRLLAEAGYPNGISKATGEPLVLFLDVVTTGDPDENATHAWIRKQFNKINIKLIIRATDGHRLREKRKAGTTQITFIAWRADYPDAENFLLMLYGPNSAALHGGQNGTNYNNKTYNRLYESMSKLEPGIERTKIINAMIKQIQIDTPMVYGFHAKAYTLNHAWLKNFSVNPMLMNKLKYVDIDDSVRQVSLTNWNKPNIYPLILLLIPFIYFLLKIFKASK